MSDNEKAIPDHVVDKLRNPPTIDWDGIATSIGDKAFRAAFPLGNKQCATLREAFEAGRLAALEEARSRWVPQFGEPGWQIEYPSSSYHALEEPE